MKLLRLLPLLCTLAAASAADVFPGLQKVMTEAEWKRAGLDRLTPDQLGVIDAALIRHYAHNAAAPVAATATFQPPAGATPAETAAAKARFWDRFGWPKLSTAEWRNLPPMTAKVTSWRGGNGFVLDNGQVWEGVEPIPFDLPGNNVIIEARPRDAFALKLNEDSIAVRVRRVK